MTLAAKVTWHNMPMMAGKSLASVPAAVIVDLRLNQAASGFAPCFSVAVWPGCVVTAATPNRLFEEQQRRLAHDRHVSAIYDSRLNKLCHEVGVDPAAKRDLIRKGYTVQFVSSNFADGSVVTHTIRPEEIR